MSIVLVLFCLFGEILTCALAEDPQLHFVLSATNHIGDALDGRLSHGMSAGEHPAHCTLIDAESLSDLDLCHSIHAIVIHTVDTLCQPMLGC